MRHRARLSIAAVAALLVPLSGCYGDPPPPHAAVEGPVTMGVFDDRTSTLPDAAKRGIRSTEARAADFDADGDLDLLVARELGTNLLLLNDGSGVFSDASDRLPRDIHDHEDIAVADFDNDGDLDAIVVADNDKAKDFYLNDGRADFEFAPAGALPLRENTRWGRLVGRFVEETRNADLGDVDKDGDLFATNTGGDQLLIQRFVPTPVPKINHP